MKEINVNYGNTKIKLTYDETEKNVINIKKNTEGLTILIKQGGNPSKSNTQQNREFNKVIKREDIYSYNNPIIPEGFKTVNVPNASWYNLYEDWDKGLVIEDSLGNQFVWVPVKDGIGFYDSYKNGDTATVKYTKWTTSGISYTNENLHDDLLPKDIKSEKQQIERFGGFYVSRYMAGSENGKVVFKKNISAYDKIKYEDSKKIAESLYTTDEVQSGLITGTSWDTILKWMSNSGYNIRDSRCWGNYNDSISPANIAGYGNLQVSGFCGHWKAKNIFDIAGNISEWTAEKYYVKPSNRCYYIVRSGCHYNSGITDGASARLLGIHNLSYGKIGFRIMLFIK